MYFAATFIYFGSKNNLWGVIPMRNFLLLSLAVVTFFISGCSNEGPTAPANSYEPVFSGRVVDKNGRPVAGAGIHYIPEFDYISHSVHLFKPNPATTVAFVVPEESAVTLVLLRLGTRDTVAYLVKDDTLNAGLHFFSTDGLNLTNGVYLCVVKYGYKTRENMFLMMSNENELAYKEPLARTNSSGEFTLPYSMLGIGLKFAFTSETGPELRGYKWISNRMSIFIAKEGYTSLKEALTADTTANFRKTFVLMK